MATITVRVDDQLKERMERHPEINWSEVTRQAITEKAAAMERLERLEHIEDLAQGSTATEEDVEEIAALVNKNMAQHYDTDTVDPE